MKRKTIILAVVAAAAMALTLVGCGVNASKRDGIVASGDLYRPFLTRMFFQNRSLPFAHNIVEKQG